MKSCKAGVGAKNPRDLPGVLGIVEVLAAGSEDFAPLEALDSCDGELSREFLERLAGRPEKLILLQCSCDLRTAEAGDCYCTTCIPRALDDSTSVSDVWQKLSKRPKLKFADVQSDSPRTTVSTISGASDFLGGCSCDGLPRVTSSLVDCFRQDYLRKGLIASCAPVKGSCISTDEAVEVGRAAAEEEARLSSDLSSDPAYDLPFDFPLDQTAGLLRHSSAPTGNPMYKILNDVLQGAEWKKAPYSDRWFNKRLEYRNMFTLRRSWLGVLEAYHALLRKRLVHSNVSKIFYLELASYLILNLGITKSLGILRSYTPTSVEGLARGLVSKNPLKQFLARLFVLRKDLAPNSGEVVSRFCVDLANLTFRNFIRPRTGRIAKIAKIQCLGDAIIFAALLGLGNVAGGGAADGQGIGVPGSSASFRNCHGIGVGLGGGIRVEGIRLQQFRDRFVNASASDARLDDPINPQAMYEIRGGQVFRGPKKIRYTTGFKFRKNDWNDHVFRDRISFELGAVQPKSLNDPLYYLERMEDLYVYKKQSSMGWNQLLREQHPYLHHEIENPRELRHIQEAAFSADHDNILTAKRYFDSLPEGSKSPRDRVSSHFASHCSARAKRLTSVLDQCRRSEPGLYFRNGSLSLKRAKRLVEELLNHALDHDLATTRDIVDLMTKVAEKTATLKPSLVEDPDAMNDIINTNTFAELLADLEYIKFKHMVNQRGPRKQLDLQSAPIARHYLLTSEGIEVVSSAANTTITDREVPTA